MTEKEQIENEIRQSLSLRKPQADSLAILAKVAKVLGDSIAEYVVGDHSAPYQ